jgi:hypothetical protein
MALAPAVRPADDEADGTVSAFVVAAQAPMSAADRDVTAGAPVADRLIRESAYRWVIPRHGGEPLAHSSGGPPALSAGRWLRHCWSKNELKAVAVVEVRREMAR